MESDQLAACYTFGSPRVATAAFARQVKAPHYRGVDGWDLVPGVLEPGSPTTMTTATRLLTGDRVMAYPRDRSLIDRFMVDLLVVLGGAVSHRLPPVIDHMIWNCRARLDEIAAARVTPTSCR